MCTTPTRILLVDDHAILRNGLADMLRREQSVEVVGATASAAEALDTLEREYVDVVLTDLRMPDMSGNQLTAQVRKRFPGVKVGVLTTYHSDEDVFQATKSGAMAYILKSATVEDILEAIHNMRCGGTWFPSRISKQLMQRLSRTELSAREMEVLRLAATGLRNREIGLELGISENTVRNHMVNLMDKMGTTYRAEAIAMGIRQGIVRLNDEDE